ncbi:CPLN2 protein, partial [Polypterus senegalus]
MWLKLVSDDLKRMPKIMENKGKRYGSNYLNWLPCTLPCSAPTIMDMFCKKQTFSDSPSKHQASCEKSKVQGESKHGLPSFFRVKKSRASDEHKKSASLEDLAGRRPRGKNGLHPAEARYGVDGLQKPIFMCTSAIVSDWLIVESSSAADKPFSVSQGREANECLRDGPARTSGTDKRSLGNVHNNLEKRKRRESKYIHSSPLYQDYWLTYVKEDIKKHSSNTSHLTTMLSMAGLLSTSLIGSTPSLKETNFSCWQDLPEVKSRGLLEGLTPQQRRLQEAMFEVITSEASYFKSLTVAVNHFVKSQELSQFLLDLEERLEESVILTDLSDLILKHSAAFRRVYIPYVTNQMYQDALVQRLLQENPKFAVALKMLEDQRVCQRQPLKSFLVLPFQRITRLKIVLENVLRLTDAESTTLESLKKAVAAISERKQRTVYLNRAIGVRSGMSRRLVPGCLVLSDWYRSAESKEFFSSLLYKNRRKHFGLLEGPALPLKLSVDTVSYKIFVCGKSGVGKTAFVAKLAGLEVPSMHHETTGIQTTVVFWPVKLRENGRILMFRLQFWDCGENAIRRFDHLLPACRDQADAMLLLFSFTDRSSFDDLFNQLARLSGPENGILKLVVGTKYP